MTFLLLWSFPNQISFNICIVCVFPPICYRCVPSARHTGTSEVVSHRSTFQRKLFSPFHQNPGLLSPSPEISLILSSTWWWSSSAPVRSRQSAWECKAWASVATSGLWEQKQNRMPSVLTAERTWKRMSAGPRCSLGPFSSSSSLLMTW